VRNELAFVLPGQGAQSAGMVRELGNEFPQVRERYEQASRLPGYDLWAAVDRFSSRIAKVEFLPPAIPLIHSVDVSAHGDAQGIRRALIDQLASPVRWSGTVDYFVRVGVRTVIECGPGKVLSTLIKRTTKSIACFPLSSNNGIQAALDHLGGQHRDIDS
jgi:malonyl CoA-acyl carrier protein transacylase